MVIMLLEVTKLVTIFSDSVDMALKIETINGK